MKLFGVYGASGLGVEVMPLARSRLPKNEKNKLVFIDDEKRGEKNGAKIVSFEEFKAIEANEKKVCLAVANVKIRRELFFKLEESQIHHWSIFAENSLILEDCQIGENTILAPFVTLTSNIRIGKSFHANIYSYVAHDCVLGDFVTFAPGVKCNGNVWIGNNVYIGSGAIIKNGKPGHPLVIGDNSIIGMGAIVSKNVAAETMVVANPSKTIDRKPFRL